MDVPSDDFRQELINKLKPCVHCLTMRPGLFRGDYCDSFDGFLAGEALSFLYVRDPGPLQDMLETDFSTCFFMEAIFVIAFTSLETLKIPQYEKRMKICILTKA